MITLNLKAERSKDFREELCTNGLFREHIKKMRRKNHVLLFQLMTSRFSGHFPFLRPSLRSLALTHTRTYMHSTQSHIHTVYTLSLSHHTHTLHSLSYTYTRSTPSHIHTVYSLSLSSHTHTHTLTHTHTHTHTDTLTHTHTHTHTHVCQLLLFLII